LADLKDSSGAEDAQSSRQGDALCPQVQRIEHLSTLGLLPDIADFQSRIPDEIPSTTARSALTAANADRGKQRSLSELRVMRPAAKTSN
jgi:hypothetical protein